MYVCLFVTTLCVVQSIYTELAKLYSKKVIFRLANLAAPLRHRPRSQRSIKPENSPSVLCSIGDSPGDGVARPSVNRRNSHGLVAEAVQTVNPDLVARDRDGKPFTARYDAVNAMLLNEFLKEHCKVEQLTKDFASQLVEQQKHIEALTAGLQKVSDQLELSKPVPQIVVDKQ